MCTANNINQRFLLIITIIDGKKNHMWHILNNLAMPLWSHVKEFKSQILKYIKSQLFFLRVLIIKTYQLLFKFVLSFKDKKVLLSKAA